MYLDRVCQHFPELKLIMPQSLLHYMNTRGKNKIMFASDHPVLSMDRCLEEAQALDLRPGILERYLYDSAHAVLFGERNPRYGEFK